jgi:hypothetical protein
MTPKNPTQKLNPNRQYKRKIRSLIVRTSKGDPRAEEDLAAELGRSSAARWVLKRMVARRARSIRKVDEASGLIRARKLPTHGSAYKPYQGGLPGLGKRS